MPSTKNSRAYVIGRSDGATTFAGDPSVVTLVCDPAGGNQVSVFAVHAEGTSATALTLDVVSLYDASTTAGKAIASLGGSDLEFPLSEEAVGTAASSVVPVTVNARQYTYGTDYLDGALPVVTFPVSTAPCLLKFTFTETASAAGTINFVVIADNV